MQIERRNGPESLLVIRPTQRNTIGYARFHSRSHDAVIRFTNSQAVYFKAFKPRGDEECGSTTFGSLIAAAILALGTESFAAGPKTYQVTGPLLEVNDSTMAVQKGKDGGNRTQIRTPNS